MTEIADAFKKKALVCFVTCGDPDLETTERVVASMVENGADLIELGIPFSDPLAEGPVIMEADERALRAGTTTDKVFELASRLTGRFDVPFVFMTYANVLYGYGLERFAKRTAEAGVKGVILPDVPYEEKDEFAEPLGKEGVTAISMISPTSEDRIGTIASASKGFLYIVSSLGVTGERKSITTDVGPMVAAVRRATSTPCAIGFGISNPEQAAAMASASDGAIVGSAIVRLIAQHGRDSPEPVGRFVRSLKDAIERARERRGRGPMRLRPGNPFRAF